MREIDLKQILPDILFRMKKEKNGDYDHIFLTMYENLSRFYWKDESLERIIQKIIHHVCTIRYHEKPIRITAARRMRMVDMEAILNMQPSYWIQIGIEVQSLSEPSADFQEEIINPSDGNKKEWVIDNSEGRLIACHYNEQMNPQILLWIHSHKANRRYVLLIPIQAN